ncbi:TetR/AcrR family transcriptional regulator [Streptomyces sp. NPDC048473]|uniref:TetR/AcrR family transcriptional regulator n=1 Tax=unclassified Streptomyces TaxID=2593676 RepID=UPI00371CE221
MDDRTEDIAATEGLNTHFECIAKEAGVGSGTLHRNFPTRESLIEAAYRNEVAELCDAAPGLLATLPPREAPRAWMSHFIDYAGAKPGMADALRAAIAAGGNPYGHSQDLMPEALSSLRQAGVEAGTLRADISATDMLTMLTGIALAAGKPDQRDQAERLLDLALDGLSTGEP